MEKCPRPSCGGDIFSDWDGYEWVKHCFLCARVWDLEGLIAEVLWHTELKEAYGQTEKHEISVKKSNGIVRATIKRK